MGILLNLFAFIAIYAVSYVITHKILPLIFIKSGRILGFKMALTPLTAKRVRRFQSIRRGHYCFLILSTGFIMSLGLELYVNNKPLRIQNGDHVQYPALVNWYNFWVPENMEAIDIALPKDFNLLGEGEIDYRSFARWVDNPHQELENDAQAIEDAILQDQARFQKALAKNAQQKGLEYDPKAALPEFKEKEYKNQREKADYLRGLIPIFASGKMAITMPIIPYTYNQQLLALPGRPPHRPMQDGIPVLGTDFDGKDVLSQLLYGFRVSFAFALIVATIGYLIGIVAGAAMGYFGGWFDILVQRFIEVWSSIPFLFTIMILASVMQPSFWVMACLLVALRAWLGITYTVRGEFYREKSRDYVQAASAMGVGETKIMLKHILPNSLVPVVTYFPFEIVAYIGALVSLDFLGFGLSADTPSWGKLLRQGAENISTYPHLVSIPVLAFATTLFCVVMIGEAVREAFDPKVYARLR